jgi:hypothetical protein
MNSAQPWVYGNPYEHTEVLHWRTEQTSSTCLHPPFITSICNKLKNSMSKMLPLWFRHLTQSKLLVPSSNPDQHYPVIFSKCNFALWALCSQKSFILVHSVQQKSSGLVFRTSHSDRDVRYSCHHNLSHFIFPIFVHSWCFSVFHSLQSITLRMYEQKPSIHSLNLKLKTWIKGQ